MTQGDRNTDFGIDGGPVPTAEGAEYRQVEVALKPRDRLEQMFAEDIAYGAQQTAMIRRATAHVLAQRRHEALYAFLVQHQPAMRDAHRVTLVARWACGDCAARGEVAALLENAGWTECSLESEAMLGSLANVLALEQLELAKLARRDKSIAGFVLYRQFRDQERRSIAARRTTEIRAPEVMKLREPVSGEQ